MADGELNVDSLITRLLEETVEGLHIHCYWLSDFLKIIVCHRETVCTYIWKIIAEEDCVIGGQKGGR